MRKTMSAVHVFELHSSAALNEHAENNFDDCDVNHSCIKTMSHSKAAIIGIKPPVHLTLPQSGSTSHLRKQCALTHTMYNSSGPLVAL